MTLSEVTLAENQTLCQIWDAFTYKWSSTCLNLSQSNDGAFIGDHKKDIIKCILVHTSYLVLAFFCLFQLDISPRTTEAWVNPPKQGVF